MSSKQLLSHAATYGFHFKQIEVPKFAITVAGLHLAWPKGRFYVASKSHAFALIDGKVIDNGGLNGKNPWIEQVFELTLSEPTNLPQLSRNNQFRFDLAELS